jgi:N-acyl-D-amino-acid deacylase
MFTKFYNKAVEEVIQVAEINNIPLQISHHAGGGLSRARKLAIKAIEEAIKRGVKIGHDNIPWPTRRTTVLKIFPAWLFDGGYNQFFKRLQDPDVYKQVIDEIYNYIPKWPPWENKYWLEKDFNLQISLNGFKIEKNLRFNHMKLKDIAKELNKDPLEALIDLAIEEEGRIFFLSGNPDDPMAEDYIIRLLQDPNCSVGTDIIGLDLNSPCPGAYGAFTRVLGKFVRERNAMPLEEAIRKMTSLPANQMQLKNRGLIKKGYYADITIFNSENIKSCATSQDPKRLSEGVEYVIINGKVVLDRAKYYPEPLAGKVIRRD